MRYRQMYGAVLGKRHRLQAQGEFSSADSEGSRVAILVPFINELVYNDDDSRSNFERQTDELLELYISRGRRPYHIMGATIVDFAETLADKSVPTVVVAGFGSLSAVAVPFSHDRKADPRYGYLDWLHLAGMATHLKLGQFVMYTCCGLRKDFNAPLPVGVVNSHRDIRAPLGQGIFATGIADNEPLMKPVTDEVELTYDAIRRAFPMERRWQPGLPDAAYVAVREVRERRHDERKGVSQPDTIPYPDVRNL